MNPTLLTKVEGLETIKSGTDYLQSSFVQSRVVQNWSELPEYLQIKSWAVMFGHELSVKNKQAIIRYKTIKCDSQYDIDIHKNLYVNEIIVNGQRKLIAENTIPNPKTFAIVKHPELGLQTRYTETWKTWRVDNDLILSEINGNYTLRNNFVEKESILSSRGCGNVIKIDILKEMSINLILNKLI